MLKNIPSDILPSIFCYLNQQEHWDLSFVNCVFFHASQKDASWNKVLFLSRKIGIRQKSSFRHLLGDKIRFETMFKQLCKHVHLQQMSLSLKGHSVPQSFHILQNHQSSLRHIILKQVTLRHKVLSTLGQLSNLSHLKLIDCKNGRRIDNLWNSVDNIDDENIYITEEGEIKYKNDAILELNLLEKCPLHTLAIIFTYHERDTEYVTDIFLNTIARMFPLLSSLTLNKCPDITVVGTTACLKSLKHLQTLDLSDNWQLWQQHHNEQIIPSSITSLFVKNIPYPISIHQFKGLSSLKWLDVSASFITDNFICFLCYEMKHLQYLNIRGCSNLTEKSRLHLKSLSSSLKELKIIN